MMQLELVLALTKCRDMAGRIHHHERPVSPLPASLLNPSGIDIGMRMHTIEAPSKIHRFLDGCLLLVVQNICQQYITVQRCRISACHRTISLI